MATPAGQLDAHRLSGRVIARWVVQALVLVAVGVTADESATVPYLHARRRDVQRVGHLLQRQETRFAQPIKAWLQTVVALQACDHFCIEGPTLARPDAPFVQHIGDLQDTMAIYQLIKLLDY